MKDFRTRILSADYGKRFRLLVAAGLCILLIGGGTSAVLLHTVDAGALGRVPQGQMQEQMQPGNMPENTPNNMRGNTPENTPGNTQDNTNGNMQDNFNRHDGNYYPGNNRGFAPGSESDKSSNDNSSDSDSGKSGDSAASGSDSGKSGDNDSSQNADTKGTVAQMASYQTAAAHNMEQFVQTDRGMTGPTMNDPAMGGHGMQGPAMGGHGMRHGGSLSMLLHNSQISIATKIAVLATTILGLIWVLLVWYTIVCYLYRSSTFSRMNRTLWTVLGVFGSILALIAFFIVRSILKVRCDYCDSWQDADQEYCTDCGSALQKKCESCGASVSPNAAFCPTCGRKLNHITTGEDSTETATFNPKPAGGEA